jgi:ferredoxin
VPTVTVEGTGVVITAKPGEAILTALCRNGYAYRFGCRRGGCGVCKVELVDGEVSYPTRVAANVLTDEEQHDGTCLSCRAVPQTDVVLRLKPDDRLRCVAPLLATINAAPAASHSSLHEGK